MTKDKNRTNQKQIIAILAYISLFILSAIFSKVTNKGSFKRVNVILIATIIVDVVCIYYIIRYMLSNTKYSAKDIINYSYLSIKNNIEITSVLSITVLMRIGMLGNMQKWDAGEYYYRLGTACDNFDFTFNGFMGFALCGHPTLGFATLMAIGEFQNHRGIVGVMIINLIITLMAIYCIYRMLTEYWTKMSKKLAALASFVCSVLPLFLGAFSYFNPDYVLAIFAIFLMYSEYKKQYIMFAFWACMICMTKETGLVIVIGYVGLRAFINFVDFRGNLLYKIERSFKDKINLAALVPILMYYLYSIISGGMFTWTQNGWAGESNTNFRWSNTDINCFGFQPTYILIKCKQFFVMNFAWMIYVIIVISFIGVVYKLIKKKKVNIEFETLYGFAGIMIAYFLFSCIYVTSALYRYNVIWVLFSGILCCIVLAEVVGTAHQVAIVVLSSLGLCMTLQSFLCIDPISMAVIPTIDTGTNKMLFSSNIDYYADTIVYNYQYTWIDKAYEYMLRDVAYNKEMNIVVSGVEWWGTQINGNPNYYEIYWNNDSKIRTMQSSENTIDIAVRSVQSFAPPREFPMYSGIYKANVEKLPRELTLCFLPYYKENEEVAISILDDYYDIGLRQTYSQFYGEVNYYKLIKKNDLENISTLYQDLTSLEDIPNASSSEIILPQEDISLSQQLNLDITEQELAIAIYNYAEEEVKDKISDGRTMIQKGDIVNLDCNIYKNDKFLRNQNIQLRVGTNEAIAELSEALIGKKMGDEVAVTCQMPDEYWNELGLSGTTLKFEMYIQGIEGKLSTNISDEYAREVSDYESAEELKQKLTKELQEERIKNYYEEMIKRTINKSEFVQYNEVEHQALEEEYYKYYEEYANKNNITFEEYREIYLSIDSYDFDKNAKKYADYMWKRSMVLKALVEKYEEIYGKEIEDIENIDNVKIIENMGYEKPIEQEILQFILWEYGLR